MPFTTVPAPAEADGGAAVTDYMKSHVARDAALTEALIGTWTHSDPDDDGTLLDTVTYYAADRTLSVTVANRKNPPGRAAATGEWSITHGFLTYRLAGAGVDKSQSSGAYEILRLDKGQLVYIDGDDKKTKIATRARDGVFATLAAPATPAAPAPPTVAAVTPAAEPTPFVDETIFVAGEDAQSYGIRLDSAVQVRLSIDIAEKVPVNVVFQRGKVTPEEYLMGLGVQMACQLISIGEAKSTKGSDCGDPFASRLSKRAAYGSFASPWVTLPAGAYTVILDNSGQVSPSRGDAPLRLRVYTKAAS